jgi:hypothetical protein
LTFSPDLCAGRHVPVVGASSGIGDLEQFIR